jgi:hypothetical protein
LDRRLGGNQNRSGCGGEEKINPERNVQMDCIKLITGVTELIKDAVISKVSHGYSYSCLFGS